MTIVRKFMLSSVVTLAIGPLPVGCGDDVSTPPEDPPLTQATLLSDLGGAGQVTAVTRHRGQAYLDTPAGLWITNGTAAGTRRLHEGRVNTLAVLGANLYYSDVRALWRLAADGQPVKVVDLPGLATVGAIIEELAPPRFVFLAPDAEMQPRLWVSDGTEAGTRRTPAVDPETLTPVRTLAFFSGEDPQSPGSGNELWVSNGTVAGTRLVKDLDPAGSSSPHGFTAWAGVEIDPTRVNTLFAATTGGAGTELWKTDGTAAGTAQLQDLEPGPGSSSPAHLAVVSPFFAVFAASVGGKRELWATDFTARGTRRIHEVEPLGPMTASSVQYDRGAFFVGGDDLAGAELWKTEGTAATTTRVLDLAPGPSSSNPTDLLFVHPKGPLVFTAARSPARFRLWALPLGSSTPSVLADLVPPKGRPAPRALAAIGQIVLVLADTGGGPSLWAADSTPLALP